MLVPLQIKIHYKVNYLHLCTKGSDQLHLPYTVSTAEAMSVARSLLTTQTYSAASNGWGRRTVRLLCRVLESRSSSVMVILTPSEDSCVRLLSDSHLHHVISGVRTPSATQVNIAGLGDTTVVLMGGIMTVAGTGDGDGSRI